MTNRKFVSHDRIEAAFDPVHRQSGRCFVSTFERATPLTDQFSQCIPHACSQMRIMSSINVLSSSNRHGQPRNVITRPRTDVFYARISLSSVVIHVSSFSFIRSALYHVRIAVVNLVTWECCLIKCSKEFEHTWSTKIKEPRVFLFLLDDL